MATVVFTANLKQHVDCPDVSVEADTVASALDFVFAENSSLKNYVLDDQKRLRKHMVIFVDGKPIKDRETLSDPIEETSEIYVMQALSGG